MKKLPAYTLTELMVVCVLMSVVVIIALQCIRIVNEQYEQYEQSQEEYLDLNEFHALIQLDNLNAKKVSVINNRILFIRDQGESVVYEWSDHSIARRVQKEGVRGDQYNLTITTMTSGFKGVQVERGIVDYVNLGLFFDNTEMNITLSKQYSAAELMKR